MSEQLPKEIIDLCTLGNYREAIRLSKSHSVETLFFASNVHQGQYGEAEKAIELLKMIIQLDSKHIPAHCNLIVLLNKTQKFEEAIEVYNSFIKQNEGQFAIYYNCGISLINTGRIKESIDLFRKAIELKPDDAMAHYKLSEVLLASQQFEEGLKENEWRLKVYPTNKIRNLYKKESWNGIEDLTNKRLLVFNEEGVGDAIQNLRYIKFLKEKGAYVILEIQKDLISLLENFKEIDELVPREDIFISTHMTPPELPEHDLVVSLSSLMYFFDPKLENTLDVDYLKVEDSSLPLFNPDKKNIGLIYAGSYTHVNDKLRSCFLKYFEDISKRDNVQLYSLQQGRLQRTWTTNNSSIFEGDDENIEVVDLTADSEEVKIVDLTANITNFKDTTQILQKLDLLITVDTSAAHLAGALGVPVYLLLSKHYDWRWSKNWYSSMKVFVQKELGDWEGLLKEVGEQIDTL